MYFHITLNRQHRQGIQSAAAVRLMPVRSIRMRVEYFLQSGGATARHAKKQNSTHDIFLGNISKN